MFLRTCGESLVANGTARWVDSVHLGSKLFITANQADHAAEGTDSSVLRESLKLCAHLLGKDLDRDLIGVLHLELRGLVANLRDHDSCIVWVAYNDRTNAITDIVDVGDAIRDDQFIRHFLLSADHNRVITTESDSCLTERVDGLESIFDLVNAAIRRKNLHHLVHCSAHGAKISFLLSQILQSNKT